MGLQQGSLAGIEGSSSYVFCASTIKMLSDRKQLTLLPPTLFSMQTWQQAEPEVWGSDKERDRFRQFLWTDMTIYCCIQSV